MTLTNASNSRIERMAGDSTTYFHPSASSCSALFLSGARPRRRDPHRQQRPDHGDVADPVDQKTNAGPGGRDQHPRDGRTHQLRSVHHGGVQGDGIAQVGALFDHLDHERLPGGHVEGVDQSLDQRQTDHPPQIDVAGERQRGQGQRLDHRQNLRDHQNAMAIPAVEPDAGDGRHEERRDLADEAGESQKEGGIGELVDDPTHGEPGHPRADERNTLAREE